MTLGQETRWGYSTKLASPHRAIQLWDDWHDPVNDCKVNIDTLWLQLSCVGDLPSATNGYSWPSRIPGSISISNNFSSGTILSTTQSQSPTDCVTYDVTLNRSSIQHRIMTQIQACHSHAPTNHYTNVNITKQFIIRILFLSENKKA